LIMQVHDELIVECALDDEGQVAVLIKQEMETAVKLDVPLIADIGTGTSWFESHQL